MAWTKGKKGEAKDFQYKSIDPLRDVASESGDGGMLLGVGSWVVDGKEGKPTFEKREYWKTEDGSRKYGKSKGLNSGDLELMLKNITRVGRGLGLPPQLIKEAIAEGINEETKTFSEWSGQPAPAHNPTGDPIPAGEPF